MLKSSLDPFNAWSGWRTLGREWKTHGFRGEREKNQIANHITVGE